ncbi:hypothetical protein WJX72_008923 [[Myrmecia] bisecta]|uniref:Uncharacterized protein n=1 Tax=[Myrmecia] bisecta TaxID=41462 RepID=A0AAW1R7L1_9CHLO
MQLLSDLQAKVAANPYTDLRRCNWRTPFVFSMLIDEGASASIRRPNGKAFTSPSVRKALEFTVRLSADRKVMKAATAPESGPADRTSVLELGFATLFAALKRPAGADRDRAIKALRQLLYGSKSVAFFSVHVTSGIGMQGLLDAWGDCPDSRPLRAYVADCSVLCLDPELAMDEFMSGSIQCIGWLACALNQLVQPSEYQDTWPYIKDGVLPLAKRVLSGVHTYPQRRGANATDTQRLYMLRNAALCGLVADGLVHLEAPYCGWVAWLCNALMMLRTAVNVAKQPAFADSVELRGDLYTSARLVTAVLAAGRKQGWKPGKAVQKLVNTSIDIGRHVGLALDHDVLKEAGSRAWHYSMLAGCRFLGELSLCASRVAASHAALSMMHMLVRLFGHGMRLLDATTNPQAASTAAVDRIRDAASEAVMVLDKILSHYTAQPAAKYEELQQNLWDACCQSSATALLRPEAQRVLEARLQRCRNFDEAEAAAQSAAEALLQEEEAAKEAKGSKKAKKKKAKEKRA